MLSLFLYRTINTKVFALKMKNVPGKSIFSLKRTRLRFAKLQVLWTDKRIFGYNSQRHVGRKPNTGYQHKHIVQVSSTVVKG